MMHWARTVTAWKVCGFTLALGPAVPLRIALSIAFIFQVVETADAADAGIPETVHVAPAAIPSASQQLNSQGTNTSAQGSGVQLAAPGQSFLERREVREFLREQAGGDATRLQRYETWFTDLQVDPAVLKRMSAPAERTLLWKDYRPIFLGADRVQAGAAFLCANRRVLAEAAQQYGVPESVIAAIVGVETFYGRWMGRDKVTRALATLAFDYPPRAHFFRQQLAIWLQLADQEGLDPRLVQGSYAGAMGYGQFIPGSYRDYAVDQNGDGRRDLLGHRGDALASIANYLAAHGWRAGEPVALRLQPDDRAGLAPASTAQANAGQVPAEVVLNDVPLAASTRIVASGQLGSWRDRLAPPVERSDPALPDDTPVAELLFQGAAGPEAWLAFTNYAVITRYNHSDLYALAVHDLSREIDRETQCGEGS